MQPGRGVGQTATFRTGNGAPAQGIGTEAQLRRRARQYRRRLAVQGRFKEAATHLEKALEIDPYYAEAWCNLGLLLLNAGRSEEAASDFRKAIGINPGYTNAHYDLGQALAVQGQIDEAMTHFRKALALARQQKNRSLAKRVEDRIRQYQRATGRP